MAGIDVGSGGGKKRATNSDINMIPFIDLLMVTIAFLLITAVWVSNSRIATNADIPAAEGCHDDCPPPGPTLHVIVGQEDFDLVWKDNKTVLSDTKIKKAAVEIGANGATATTYPELAKTIGVEWKTRGLHKDPSDRGSNIAVLHTANATAFREIVAVLDAIDAARRDVRMPDGKLAAIPAFKTTFSASDR